MFVAEGTPTKKGFTDDYLIRLSTKPRDDVTISLWTPKEYLSMVVLNETVTPAQNVTVSKWIEQIRMVPDSLVFTPLNWEKVQTVTVHAIYDDIKEGAYNPEIKGTDTGNHYGYVYHNVTSLDVNYNAPNGSSMRSGSCQDPKTIMADNATSVYDHPDKEMLYIKGRQVVGDLKACLSIQAFYPDIFASGACAANTKCCAYDEEDPTICNWKGAPELEPLNDEGKVDGKWKMVQAPAGALTCCPTDYCCPEVYAPVMKVTITEDDPSPAPVLKAAVFSDTGAEIDITFDSVTDRGGVSGTVACSRLFQGVMSDPALGTSVVIEDVKDALGADRETTDTSEGSADPYSEGPFNSCGWITDSTIRITLGAGATIIPEQMLGIVEKRVKASPNAKLTSSGSVRVRAPRNPPIPLPLIKAPDLLGLCDDMSLDASSSQNSGGRKMTFMWTVECGNQYCEEYAEDTMSNITAILDVANTYDAKGNGGLGQDTVILDKDLMMAGSEYIFTLFVKNFLSPGYGHS
jgi:hypothetical protein